MRVKRTNSNIIFKDAISVFHNRKRAATARKCHTQLSAIMQANDSARAVISDEAQIKTGRSLRALTRFWMTVGRTLAACRRMNRRSIFTDGGDFFTGSAHELSQTCSFGGGFFIGWGAYVHSVMWRHGLPDVRRSNQRENGKRQKCKAGHCETTSRA